VHGRLELPASIACAGLAYIPAPKLKLPGHEESYNPPKEYLPTEVSMPTHRDYLALTSQLLASQFVISIASCWANLLLALSSSDTSQKWHRCDILVLLLQEEKKGFQQIDEEDRTGPLAQIYPSLRQVSPCSQ